MYTNNRTMCNVDFYQSFKKIRKSRCFGKMGDIYLLISFHFAGVFKITSRISPTTQTRGICLDQLWFYRTGTKRCCSGNGTIVLRRKRISVWFRFKNREWRGNSCNAVSISGTSQNKKISKMRGNTPQTKLTCHDAHYQKNVPSGIYHILGELRQEKRHYKRANGMYAD